MKNLILILSILLFISAQCERKERETYYLSESEKQFCPYKIGDVVKMLYENDTIKFTVVTDSSYIHQLYNLYVYYIEERRVSLVDDGSQKIDITINKLIDPFCIYFDFKLDQIGEFGFQVEPFDEHDWHDKNYNIFIGDTIFNSSVYSEVYLVISGSSSVEGYVVDSLYYNRQNGLIRLIAEDKVFRFEGPHP